MKDSIIYCPYPPPNPHDSSLGTLVHDTWCFDTLMLFPPFLQRKHVMNHKYWMDGSQSKRRYIRKIISYHLLAMRAIHLREEDIPNALNIIGCQNHNVKVLYLLNLTLSNSHSWNLSKWSWAQFKLCSIYILQHTLNIVYFLLLRKTPKTCFLTVHSTP